MAERVFRKLDVGKHLLDQAIALLIEDEDEVSALVLGGTAEDVFQGLLQRSGSIHLAARHIEVNGAAELMGVVPPTRDAEIERSLLELIRHPFNWARHADRAPEQVETTGDWRKEALWVIDRAASNLEALTGERHPRADEIDQLISELTDD